MCAFQVYYVQSNVKIKIIPFILLYALFKIIWAKFPHNLSVL